MEGNAEEETDRILTISLLKSFRTLELLAASAVLGAIIGTMCSTKGMITELLAGMVCLVGFASLYMGFRIRLDASLFEQWNQLDTEQLDRALRKFNSGFEAGRRLEARLCGARILFKRGTQLVALQAVLVLLLIGSCIR